MKKTSYFAIAKLNPNEDDEHKIDRFCRNTQSFGIYSIDRIRPQTHLLEGAIVFSKKITIFEASDIFTGFTVSYLDDFQEKVNEIYENEVVRSVNKHPAIAVRMNLLTLFDENTVADDGENSIW